MSDQPPRPALLPVDPATVPPELAAGERFLAWRWTWKPPTATAAGKWDKPPFDATSGKLADATDPRNGVSLAAALAAVPRLGMSGIGRQLVAADGFIAWDFDACYDPQTQTITEPRRRRPSCANSIPTPRSRRAGRACGCGGRAPRRRAKARSARSTRAVAT